MENMSSSDKEFLKRKLISWITLGLIGWFVFLGLTHLFLQRPLWNDEEVVFNSIEAFGIKEMFGSMLLAAQAFPRVYLFAIQKTSQLFDYSLLSLRFPSFLCMLGAFLIWLRIGKYEFKKDLHYLVFAASWTACGMLLYYSAELKQYSMDVLTAAVFLLFLYKQFNLESARDDRRYLTGLLLLPLLGLFSYTAFLFTPFPLWNLIVSRRSNPRWKKHVFTYLSSLVFFVALAYFIDLRFSPGDILRKGYGDYFISFASVESFFQSFGEGVNNLFSRWFVERPKYFKGISRCFVGFGLIYMFYGFFKNIKREGYYFKSIETIAFIVFLELFLLGALKRYFFTVPRTSLFFCPIVLYLTLKGILVTERINRIFFSILLTAYMGFLLLLIVMYTKATFIGELSFMPTIW